MDGGTGGLARIGHEEDSAVRSDDVAITFVNHATFLIQTGGNTILTDPVWSERASPLRRIGPKRVRKPGVAFEIDIAMLGIGAYEPRWFMKPIHMNPAEAVRAHRDLGSRQSIGMHFGTFQLTAEPIDQPQLDLKRALSESGIPDSEFVTLHEGETRIYRGRPA